MKSLTKPWGDFNKTDVNDDSVVLTERLILKKINDPERKNNTIYLAINTLSGAIDVFSEEYGKVLERMMRQDSGADLPDLLRQKLQARGYIFPAKNIAELAYQGIIEKHKRIQSNDSKMIAFFAIGTSCNMKCEYCFERKNLGDGDIFEKSVMSEDSLKSSLNALEFFAEMGGKKIEWVAGYGGEPLQGCYASANEIFMQKVSERNIPIVYFSNLATVNDELWKLLEKNRNKISFIQTTLDGVGVKHNLFRKVRDAFEKTVSSIDRLLNLGIPVTVRTNISPDNIENIPELADFYQEKGWFEHGNFKALVTRLIDRHHDGYNIYTENEAISAWLNLRDQYKNVRKIYTYNLAPTIYNILLALQPRMIVDGIHDINKFEIDINPILTHCSTDTRTDYVFTGEPSNSIYICAECAGLTKYRVGVHAPKLEIFQDKLEAWGKKNGLNSVRSVDNLDKCSTCKVATFCGGNCSLEACTAHGCADHVFCCNTPKMINDFIDNENPRIYNWCKKLLNNDAW